MANYHDMWEMIRKHFFPITKELLVPLSCRFCGNLAINAYQSKCKCNYCYDCLNILFSHGSDECVCGLKFSGEGDNEMRENIIPAEEINKKISELKVKCPVKDCTYRTALIDINNHLKSCDKKQVECNFQLVGCKKKLVDKKDLWDHLAVNVLSHNKLLIKWIFNNMSKLSIDFIDLKNQILETELVELDKRLSRIMALASEENEEKQTAIDQLESDVSNIKNRNKEFGKFTRKIHNINVKQNKEIGELKQSIEIQNKEIANLRKIVEHQNEENVRMRNVLQDLVRKMPDFTTDQINIEMPNNILELPKLEMNLDLSLTNIPSITKETTFDIPLTQSKPNETVEVKSKTKSKAKKLNSKNKTKINKSQISQASTTKSEISQASTTKSEISQASTNKSETSSQSNQTIQNKPVASNYISTQRGYDFYDYDDYDDYDDDYNDIYDNDYDSDLW